MYLMIFFCFSLLLVQFFVLGVGLVRSVALCPPLSSGKYEGRLCLGLLMRTEEVPGKWV